MFRPIPTFDWVRPTYTPTLFLPALCIRKNLVMARQREQPTARLSVMETSSLSILLR